jgi:hypothetical protein
MFVVAKVLQRSGYRTIQFDSKTLMRIYAMASHLP